MQSHVWSTVPARLGAAMVVVLVALISGCSGPPTPQFSPMPIPGQQESPGYTTILGPVSGSGSKTLVVSARPGMAVWLGCIGKGAVRATTPIGVSAICGSGNSFVGGTTQPTHYRRGQKLIVRIVSPADATWEIRIDGAPWAA
jgi:hypothetical protein